MAVDNTLWSDEELKDSVFAYKSMQKNITAGKPVIKKSVYRELAKKWGRTEKSYEMRMSNISAVLDLHGRTWIKGLKPLSNVGTNVISVLNKYLNEFDGGTDFSDPVFELEVAKKVKERNISMPIGNLNPTSKKSTVTLIDRDPNVKAWLLVNSNGICENCNSKAPFISTTGIPYLEVHHVKRLSDSGPDTPENAVALCPNCHKAFHYSKDRESLISGLYVKIKRLKI
jgi:5-methylcytosine-specific restriction protein A